MPQASAALHLLQVTDIKRYSAMVTWKKLPIPPGTPPLLNVVMLSMDSQVFVECGTTEGQRFKISGLDPNVKYQVTVVSYHNDAQQQDASVSMVSANARKLPPYRIVRSARVASMMLLPLYSLCVVDVTLCTRSVCSMCTPCICLCLSMRAYMILYGCVCARACQWQTW